MEIYERIKDLRKNYLKLSQEAFGGRLGVSRSVINNIERNALARPDQKLSLYKLICSEFNVNEDWLLNGNKPMFIESDTFSLDKFMKQRGATDLEMQIAKTYFELDPEIRKTLIDHFKKNMLSFASSDNEKVEKPIEQADRRSIYSSYDNAPATAEELERLCPPIEPEERNKKTS